MGYNTHLLGRSRRDPLLPILRSEAQGKVLATVFLAPPEESLHLRAIAKRAGLPFSTVQREVDRLEDAGLIRSERFAQARVVRPDESSPLADDVRALILKAYGPVVVLSEALSEVPHIQEAFIFGSWAARYEGEEGAVPGDVDVLVLGSPPVDAVHDALAAAEDRLGRNVEPTIVSPEEWRSARSGFLRTIRRRPLVRLNVGAE